MPFIGNPARLGQLARTLERLGEVPSRAAAPIAEAIEQRLQDDFAAESNSYGRTWAGYSAGSIRRGRTPPMLQETRNLVDSLRVVPMAGSGVRIVWDMTSSGDGGSAGYPRFHFEGTKYMPIRSFLPDSGMPATWAADIKRIMTETFRSAGGK